MKWPTNKLKYYDVPLYKQRIWLVTDREVFSECMEVLGQDRKELPYAAGKFSLFTNNKTGQSVFMVAVFDGTETTLLHECAHATFIVLEHVGVDAMERCNEAYCYLLEDMFKNLKKKMLQ